ncbi:hypothetical protein LOCC1_G003192, partial [Lachnellula occidentalis]
MAAIPTLKDTGRRSSSSHRRANMSHGRGGAGNIGNADSDHQPVTLETPTIKSQMYTTGRGGSGNMAKNDSAEEARRAQDVVGSASPSLRSLNVHIHPRRESTSSTHVGRGGAANVFSPSAEEIAKAKNDNAKWESALEDEEKD